MTGRAQAAQAIEQLLSTVPDQALTDFAAGLPEGDPMYAHAGRVLQARGLPLPRPYDLAALWAVHAGNRPPADHDGYRPPMRLGVLLPLLYLVLRAVGAEPAELREIVFRTRNLELLWNTLLLTTATLTTTTLVALPLAFVTARSDFKGRGLALLLGVLPLALPGYVGAYTWLAATGQGGTLDTLLGLRLATPG